MGHTLANCYFLSVAAPLLAGPLSTPRNYHCAGAALMHGRPATSLLSYCTCQHYLTFTHRYLAPLLLRRATLPPQGRQSYISLLPFPWDGLTHYYLQQVPYLPTPAAHFKSSHSFLLPTHLPCTSTLLCTLHHGHCLEQHPPHAHPAITELGRKPCMETGLHAGQHPCQLEGEWATTPSLLFLFTRHTPHTACLLLTPWEDSGASGQTMPACAPRAYPNCSLHIRRLFTPLALFLACLPLLTLYLDIACQQFPCASSSFSLVNTPVHDFLFQTAAFVAF